MGNDAAMRPCPPGGGRRGGPGDVHMCQTAGGPAVHCSARAAKTYMSTEAGESANGHGQRTRQRALLWRHDRRWAAALRCAPSESPRRCNTVTSAPRLARLDRSGPKQCRGARTCAASSYRSPRIRTEGSGLNYGTMAPVAAADLEHVTRKRRAPAGGSGAALALAERWSGNAWRLARSSRASALAHVAA